MRAQCNAIVTIHKTNICNKLNDFAHRIQCAINLNKYVQNKIKNVHIIKHIYTQYNCAKQMNDTLCKTLCNKNINNTVQNFVQCCAIHEQNLCAIFFILLLCKKTVQYFVKISAILAMLAYCTIL